MKRRFNIRVCAVMIHQEALLIMRDEAMPYAYLPGGRIQFQETAEAALQRELKEELKIEAEILRPLWLCQSFFMESSSQEKFHELCLYFLVNPNNSERLIQDQTISVFERKVKYLTQRLILYLQIDFMFYGNFLTVDKRISG